MRRVRLLLLLPLLIPGGCSSSRPGAEDVWSQLLDGPSLLAIGADEAWWSESGVLLRYRASYDMAAPGQTVHALAPWDTDPAAAPGEDVVNTLAEPRDREEWETLRADATPLRVLSALHWQAVRDGVLGALASDDPAEGVVIRLGSREELLLVRDEHGAAVPIALEDRPAGVSISDSRSQRALMDTVHETVEQTLAELGVSEQRVVLDTGQTGQAGFLSVYVDLEADVIVLHRMAAPGSAGSRTLGRGAQTTNRVVVQGTVVEVITRPVSTLYGVLFTVKHGVTDLVKPTDSRRALTMGTEPAPLNDGPGMDLDAFERRLDVLTSDRPSLGTLRYHVGGDAFFPRLFEAVQEAEESVDVRMFIFKTDDFAVRVADLLRERAEEADVRVLLDGVGTTMGVVTSDPSMPPDFTPPLSIISYLERGSDVDVRVRTSALLFADHTKTILIDEETCFLGGMNIGREYRYDWHDLMVEVTGPIATKIGVIFDEAWAHAGWSGDLGYLMHVMFRRRPIPPPPGPDSFPIRVLRTQADHSEIYRAQLLAIRSAQRRIIIENAYFADDEILTEVVAARLRGVDVRVILPLEGNHGIMNAANLVMANVMLRYGIRVYLSPGMTHVKAAVYDGWACLGSANFDRLSLRRNQELNIAFSDEAAVQALVAEVLAPDMQASFEVTEPFDTDWSTQLQGFLAGML